MQFRHVGSKAGGYPGINLHFRRGIVEAEIETDIKNRMLINPEVHAQVERINRWCRPVTADRRIEFDRGNGALDTGYLGRPRLSVTCLTGRDVHLADVDFQPRISACRSYRCGGKYPASHQLGRLCHSYRWRLFVCAVHLIPKVAHIIARNQSLVAVAADAYAP